MSFCQAGWLGAAKVVQYIQYACTSDPPIHFRKALSVQAIRELGTSVG